LSQKKPTNHSIFIQFLEAIAQKLNKSWIKIECKKNGFTGFQAFSFNIIQ